MHQNLLIHYEKKSSLPYSMYRLLSTLWSTQPSLRHEMYGSWIFNNVMLMLMNFLVVLYFGQRFFQIMKNHYKLVAEITEFNSIVRQSRLSLDFTTARVSEAMKEIEEDIAEELNITQKLTKLNGKMTSLLKRFNALEEQVIELVRKNSNMESITISTPKDISTEIKKVLRRKKKLDVSAAKQIDNINECLVLNVNNETG